MRLFSHRSSTSNQSFYNSKPLKYQKPNSASSSTRPHLPLLIFSAASLFVGILGTVYAISASHRPEILPIFRCGKSEDTFRALYSSSGNRKLGNNGAVVDRPKLLGFVGIQTGFDSVDRRTALRSTWFPSDPDGLLRYLVH